MADEAAALRILEAVPRAPGGPRPSLEAVERVHERFPGLGMEELARELDYWARHGNGTRRKIKSVMGTFQTFARRAQEDRRAASHSPREAVPSEAAQGWDRNDFE